MQQQAAAPIARIGIGYNDRIWEQPVVATHLQDALVHLRDPNFDSYNALRCQNITSNDASDIVDALNVETCRVRSLDLFDRSNNISASIACIPFKFGII